MPALPLDIANFFLAMQSGPPGLDRLRAMFTDDATYTEPFSGSTTPHIGPDAITAAFAGSRTDAFDDAVIELAAVDVDGPTITDRWTCISAAIPGGRGSGTNVFELRNGKIAALITTLDMEP